MERDRGDRNGFLTPPVALHFTRYRWWYGWALACCLPALLWLRCPSVITHAQFWAEDGWSWYPDAYDHGWRSLWQPHAGYLQSISRLVALASQVAPLAWAPAIFAVAALLMQTAPSWLLLSPRLAAAIPPVTLRIFLALLLVALPGTRETYVNLTNAQWYLSILAFLVLGAAPATTFSTRVFDAAVLLLSGLSGPFAIFLAPVALMWWWIERGVWRLCRLAIVAAAASVQIGCILALTGERNAGALNASVHGLVTIVIVQIIGPAMIGLNRVIQHGRFGLPSAQGARHFVLPGMIVLAAAVLAMVALIRGRWIFRGFIIFVAFEFAASLLDGITPAWWTLMQISDGGRYFLHPLMAWLAIVISLGCDGNKALRFAGRAGVAVAVLLAVPADWRIAKLPSTAFYADAAAFEKLPPGKVMAFDIRPAGRIYLVKR